MTSESSNVRDLLWTAVISLLLMSIFASSVLAQSGTARDTAGTDASSFFLQRRWSPYWVGVGIGVLSWLTFLFSQKALGISTAYARTFGMLEKALRGAKVDNVAYFKKYAPKVDWEWMLVVGVVIGAFLSAKSSGDFGWEIVPPFWRNRVGDSAVVRWLVALVGGMVMGVGARWAGGCTSGHGISGTLQLAVSSWLAALCFFVGGVATAMLLFQIAG